MKWIYVIILVAIMGIVLSNDKYRNWLFSDQTTTEQADPTSDKSGGVAGRLGEVEATSEMGSETSR